MTPSTLRETGSGDGVAPQKVPPTRAEASSRPRRLLLLAFSGLSLSACGFKLRQAPNFAFRSIYIDASGGLPLANELRQKIGSAENVQVLTEPAQLPDAEVILDILSNLRDEVVVAQNSSGQVQEFTLRLRIRFRLRTQLGKDLIPETELLQQRDVSYNETAALAKEAEKALLFRGMQTDLVQQIMLRLGAVREL